MTTATAQKEKTILPAVHLGIMDILMKMAPLPVPKADDLIEGIVLGQERSVLFVDLSPVGTGIIYGREYNRAKDIIRALVPGDKITVKIAELENERGYFSLSLKEAKQKMVWKEAEDLQKTKTPLVLSVIDANKGGLVMEWNGVQGFLPTSQLKSSHYPRVQEIGRAHV